MTEREDPFESLGYSRNPKEIDPARNEAARQRKAGELGLEPDASWAAITAEELRQNRPVDEVADIKPKASDIDDRPALKSREQVDQDDWDEFRAEQDDAGMRQAGEPDAEEN